MTVGTPHADDRETHWAYVAEHAAPGFRSYLLRLAEIWDNANDRWFSAKMTRPIVLLTAPSTPTRYGEHAHAGGYGEPGEIRIRLSLLDGTHPKVHGHPEGCFRFAADVLLHESIHQYQFEIAGNSEPSYHGHGPQFTAWCNLIGADLGLPQVVCRNRKGSKNPRSAQWPHNVRPPGYYLGAYEQPGPEEEPKDETEDVPDSQDDVMPCPHCGGTGEVPRDLPRSALDSYAGL